MRCTRYDILISAYIDGELSVSEEKRLMAHVGECSACRKKLESLKVLSDQINRMSRIEGEISERNRLIANLREQLEPQSARKIKEPFFTPRKIALVSVVSLAVILLIVYFYMPRGTGSIGGDQIDPLVPEPEWARFEQIFIDGMADYLVEERVHAGSNEVFSEPIQGVFEAIPPSPVEGTYNDMVENPSQSGG